MAASTAAPEVRIRSLLEAWASATRENRKDDVLANHDADVLIFDVLAPLRYEGAAAYRRSWAEWQPESPADGVFALEDLSITAGTDVAFATALIRCGGTLPNGHRFEDLVRATFCLENRADAWRVTHQHISKPIQLGGG